MMHSSAKLDAVLFDFDGTLAELTIDFDLMKRRIAAVASALLERDVSPDGTPVLEWLDALESSAPTSDLGKELHSRGRLIVTATELEAAGHGKLFSFTRSVLDELARSGVKSGVITRNCTPAVLKVFPDLRDHCQVFLPREDARKLKPDPGHLIQALHILGVEPDKVLMVGDHPMDVATAKSAGARSAAVWSGRTGPEDLARMHPDYLAPDAADLLRQLKALEILPKDNHIA
ncbi:MAG: HAD family hydrolase [Desulfovibrionaceae bacterium]|jgi:phosphoglycolate phosphatase